MTENNHYFIVEVPKDVWNEFVNTFPRQKSIQSRLNEMIVDEVQRHKKVS